MNKIIILISLLLVACGEGGKLSPQGGTVVSVTATVGGGLAVSGTTAKPTVGLTLTCSTNQVLKWNGSAWGCGTGGLTNSAGNNVVMKSDGTNAVPSGILDDGTTVTIGSEKLGLGGSAPSGSQHSWIYTNGVFGRTITTQLYITEDDTLHTGVVGNNEAISLVADQRATFDCTTGACTSRGAEVDVSSTRVAGAGPLTNIGIVANVQGGDSNYAVWATHGILRVDDASTLGDLTASGNITLGGVAKSVVITGGAGSSISFTGAGGAVTTAGAIQGATLRSTGNTQVDGEFIMSATGDQYWYASRANTSGNANINLDSAGTGVVRINSNTGGLANAGTGGLEVYAGGNSATLLGAIRSTGITTVGGAKWSSGVGSPETAVTGNVGDLWSRTNGGGGTTLYIKESGTGNVGWTAVASGGGGSITSIVAGTGLSGGGSSGTVTIDVNCLTGLDCNANNINLSNRDWGDITSTDAGLGAGTQWTIDPQSVSYSKIQNVSATSRLLGRITAGAGTMEELTGTQATSLLDTFSTATTTKGLVPGSNGSTGCLKGNGTWGTCGITNGAANNIVLKSDGTNAVASSITDNGSAISTPESITTTTGTAFIQAGADVYSYSGNVYLGNGDIGCQYNTNATATCFINKTGFSQGATQFRDLKIQDGKGADILAITGSTKAALFSGNITTSGNIATTGSGNISSNTYLNAGTSIYSNNGAATSMFLNGNGTGCAYGTNATAKCLINDLGYQEGQSQFRDLEIRDGKGAAILTITGSSKLASFVGNTNFGDGSTDETKITGNLYSVGQSPGLGKPTISGTGCSLVSGGSAGFIVSTAGSGTSCTATFANAFLDKPACSITWEGGSGQSWPHISSVSGSALTFNTCNSTACGGNTMTGSYHITCVGTSVNSAAP